MHNLTTSLRTLSFALLFAAGCGDDGSSDDPTEDGAGADETATDGGTPADDTAGPDTDDSGSSELGPAYLFTQDIATADASEGAISILANLDPQTIDLTQALTVPQGGAPLTFTELGYVFVPNPEDFTLTRYEISAERTFDNPVVLSFAGLGVTSFHGFFVISEDRAYATTGDGLLAVWDPSEMAIVQTVPLIDLEVEGQPPAQLTFFERSFGPPLERVMEQEGLLVLGVQWPDWDNLAAAPQLGALSISTTDPTDQQLTVSGCSSQTWNPVLGTDGDLYFLGAPAWGPFYAHADPAVPESALLRFDAQTRAFDESSCQTISDLSGGQQSGLAMSYTDESFIIRTMDTGAVDSSSVDEYWSDIEFSCTFWEGTIGGGQASLTPIESINATIGGACYTATWANDDQLYMPLIDEGWDGGQMARLTENGLEPLFGMAGFPYTFQRIR